MTSKSLASPPVDEIGGDFSTVSLAWRDWSVDDGESQRAAFLSFLSGKGLDELRGLGDAEALIVRGTIWRIGNAGQ